MASALHSRFPLDSSQQQIRLLHLLPGSWDDTIECKLVTVSLQDSPAYNALSYVWGDKNDTCKIHVEGEDVRVTKNLFAALRRIRAHRDTQRATLWADAICIDQSNVQKRNVQVALMGQIYTLCQSVLIWLGEATDNVLERTCGTCVQFRGNDSDFNEHWETYLTELNLEPCSLKDVSFADAAVDSAKPVDGLTHFAWLIRLFSGEREYHITELPPFCSRKLEQSMYFFVLSKAFDFMASNPYFDRLWVIQESILAPSARVLWGPVELPVDMIIAASDRYKMHIERGCCSLTTTERRMAGLDLNVALHCFVYTANWRGIRRRQQSIHLFDLCLTFSDRLTSDPLDHIYGLLGLAARLGAAGCQAIQPDYRQNVASVYTRVSRDYCDNGHSLVLWLMLPITVPQIPGLPSWALGWSVFSQRTESLWGWHVDRVTQVGSVLNAFDDVQRRDTFRCWQRLTTVDRCPDRPYVAGGTWREAWWRTLSGDCSYAFARDILQRLPASDMAESLASVESANMERLGASLASRRPRAENGDGATLDQYSPVIAATTDLEVMILGSIDERAAFVTQKGYFGLGRKDVRPGDVVYVLAGASTPCLLRETDDFVLNDELEVRSRAHTLLNGCYVHGIMDGKLAVGRRLRSRLEGWLRGKNIKPAEWVCIV